MALQYMYMEWTTKKRHNLCPVSVICIVYIRTNFMIRDVYKLPFSYIHLLVGTSLFMTYNIVYLSTTPFVINNHFDF